MSVLKHPQSPVVIFTHEFFPKKGGIATFTQEMALALNTLGYCVDVFAPSHPELRASTFPYTVETVHCDGTQDWSCRLKSCATMLRSRKRLEDSIVYLPEPGPIRILIYLQVFSLLKPKKVILTLHGSEINRLTAFPHRKYLFGRLLDQCWRITVPSNFTCQLLLKQYPMIKSKVVLTPGAPRSGLSTSECTSKKRGEQLTILTVARIHPRKGQHFVLQAINALSSETKLRILYRIVGPVVDKRYLRKLKAYAVQNKINVSFEGELSDRELSRTYQQADVFAMTSRPYRYSIEGFGLTYLEASANGVPILAHRTGGVEDAVKDGINGLLTNPGDQDGLAAALKRLLFDNDLRVSLTNGGREWAARFSWEKNVIAAFQ